MIRHVVSCRATRFIRRVMGHRWIGSSMHTQQAKGSEIANVRPNEGGYRSVVEGGIASIPLTQSDWV
jgi:hypothetical protein